VAAWNVGAPGRASRQPVTQSTVVLRHGVAANQLAHVLAGVDAAAQRHSPVGVLAEVRR
jgi:hypothetical protein